MWRCAPLSPWANINAMQFSATSGYEWINNVCKRKACQLFQISNCGHFIECASSMASTWIRAVQKDSLGVLQRHLPSPSCTKTHQRHQWELRSLARIPHTRSMLEYYRGAWIHTKGSSHSRLRFTWPVQIVMSSLNSSSRLHECWWFSCLPFKLYLLAWLTKDAGSSFRRDDEEKTTKVLKAQIDYAHISACSI